ncbi:MAG: VOC family protein [Alphaproteobacteria bacterium]|nr:VOC family protein [Alphaproteobacteria bacterium]
MPGENQSVLRRASLFVRDMDRAIAFYRGVFGLSLYIDREMPLSVVPSFPVGREGRGGTMRFVMMRGWDPLIGMIGLMEVKDPPLDEPQGTGRLGYGSIPLVLETRDAAAVAQSVETYGGSVLMTPTEGRNLGDAAGNFIPALVMMATDPDGHFLEIFQAL